MKTNYTESDTQETIAVYEKPSIEIIEMEIQGTILRSSGDSLGNGGGGRI